MIDIYLGFKNIARDFAVVPIVCILLAITTKTMFPLLLLLMSVLAIIIVVTILWFAQIKPYVKEIEKEIELEDKYPFLLNKFIKGE